MPTKPSGKPTMDTAHPLAAHLVLSLDMCDGTAPNFDTVSQAPVGTLLSGCLTPTETPYGPGYHWNHDTSNTAALSIPTVWLGGQNVAIEMIARFTSASQPYGQFVVIGGSSSGIVFNRFVGDGRWRFGSDLDGVDDITATSGQWLHMIATGTYWNDYEQGPMQELSLYRDGELIGTDRWAQDGQLSVDRLIQSNSIVTFTGDVALAHLDWLGTHWRG